MQTVQTRFAKFVFTMDDVCDVGTQYYVPYMSFDLWPHVACIMVLAHMSCCICVVAI